MVPQNTALRSSEASPAWSTVRSSGQESGLRRRKDGPWLHLFGTVSSFRFFPRVTSSAGFLPESTYLQECLSVSSCISATRVPTKTLNRQDSDLSQVSTVVESDHRTVWSILRVSSLSSTYESCAPVSAAQSSNRGMEWNCLGATLERATKNDRCTSPFLPVVRR